MDQEKRRYPRENTVYTALFCLGQGAFSVRIKDLSHSGAAVILKRDTNLKIGGSAELHFYAQDAGTLVAKLSCKIVRAFTEDGKQAAGLEFKNSSRAVDTIMEQLVKHSEEEALENMNKALEGTDFLSL